MNQQIEYFMKRSIDRHGYKTYLLIQENINSTNYNIITLDKSESSNKINNSDFHIFIPSILEKKYTVIIIDYKNEFTLDIKTVHQPSQKQLHLPPLFV